MNRKEETTAPVIPPWDSFVAIGDSFTEGMTDALEDGSDDPLYVGWADRLAMELSRRRIAANLAPLKYANLAVRGKLIGQVNREQLDTAIAMKPALMSIIAGGNDMIRPGSSADKVAALLEEMVVKVRSQGIEVLLCAHYAPRHSPVLGLARPTVAIFNSNLWSIARRHGCYVMDQWGLRSLNDTSILAPDRLHLTGEGHQIMMNAALEALGQPVVDADYQARAPVGKDRFAASENVTWVKDHLWPWVKRHSRGRSSGDGRSPKYPQLVPVTDDFLE
ncbi:SGNH/GDSL hydrolase family protein [uncultured Varibaculum sp.]|uniref:SGNH/GDSL hydrolase family protein n=1 Tax=uncultured Varibaculum sp. TaxID=413896 RepID=UPI00258A419E|nr:SGNH/GDSL hydrolase family protein [uncultured Varibaculum sp.]